MKMMTRFYWVNALFVLSIAWSTNTLATDSEILGVLDNYQGIVKHYKNNGVKGLIINQPTTKLKKNDSLRTKRNSTAYITLTDNSKIILTERSQIHFKGINRVTYDQGKVLFDIKKQGNLKGFQITSGTAVIGVKGTMFLVDNTDDKLSIYMKEGTVSVKSIKGQFKRFKQKQEDEFEAFRQKNLTDFNDHKKKLENEFVEYVNSFNLSAGHAISIDDDKVRDVKIPKYIDNMFKMFENK